ncbi:probable cytochrome P450 9f2 [Aedes albopictus]|uniref:Cytochrome n=1 Tax=Aedes albopictus TaxID=7160 RepID=A0ABM1YD83_AEDAL
MFFTLVIFAGLILLFYYNVQQKYKYFKIRGIPYAKPSFLLGSGAPLVLKKKDMLRHIQDLYQTHPQAKIMGLFDFTAPVWMVRDPDTIKQLGVKDFDHFSDHTPIYTRGDVQDMGTESLFGNSLLLLRGQKWRDMRATLSPAFTGSRMREMFELVSECARSMVEYFGEEARAGKRLEYEMKDVFTRFSNDVIASVAFGIKVDSLREQDNEFFVNGKELMNFRDMKTVAKVLLMRMFPRMMIKLKADISSAEMNAYFRGMIMDNMRQREAHGIVRHDMINLLMQVRQGTMKNRKEDLESTNAEFAAVEETSVGSRSHNRVWSDNELAAQCFLFFIAGSETVSTCLTFLAYELLINPDVQEKLYQEIMEVERSLGGKSVGYDQLQSMKYMDMVVSENLRLWPPAPFSDRYCAKDYRYDDGQGTRVTIEKGQIVWFPTTALQHDPEYFPNPYKFDPERFSEQNRDKIRSGTYLPFGIGPRACIGSRLALLEVKVVAYYLVKNFRLVRSERSMVPLKLKSKMIGMEVDGGVWLGLEARN